MSALLHRGEVLLRGTGPEVCLAKLRRRAGRARLLVGHAHVDRLGQQRIGHRHRQIGHARRLTKQGETRNAVSVGHGAFCLKLAAKPGHHGTPHVRNNQLPGQRLPGSVAHIGGNLARLPRDQGIPLLHVQLQLGRARGDRKLSAVPAVHRDARVVYRAGQGKLHGRPGLKRLRRLYAQRLGHLPPVGALLGADPLERAVPAQPGRRQLGQRRVGGVHILRERQLHAIGVRPRAFHLRFLGSAQPDFKPRANRGHRHPFRARLLVARLRESHLVEAHRRVPAEHAVAIGRLRVDLFVGLRVPRHRARAVGRRAVPHFGRHVLKPAGFHRLVHVA